MKILVNILFIVFLGFTNMNNLFAQSPETKLDQIELMKQFIGSWEGELGNGFEFRCENNEFGNGIISNSQIIEGNKIVDRVTQIYGYDSKRDKFIIAELKESSPVIELCLIWFTTEHTGEIIIINPENSSIRFKYEFKTPEEIEQIALQDDKMVSKILLKRLNDKD